MDPAASAPEALDPSGARIPSLRGRRAGGGCRMSEAEPVGVGFLGCGRIADLQCLGYLDHPRARDRRRLRPRRGGGGSGPRAWGRPALHGRRAAPRRPGGRCRRDPDAAPPPRAHAIAALASGQARLAAEAADAHARRARPPAPRRREQRPRVRVFENFMYYPPHGKARAGRGRRHRRAALHPHQDRGRTPDRRLGGDAGDPGVAHGPRDLRRRADDLRPRLSLLPDGALLRPRPRSSACTPSSTGRGRGRACSTARR